MERLPCDRIDYTNLNNFLEAKEWRSADRETNNLLLTISQRNSHGWLRIKDLKQIDCFDFFLLDRLWGSHSEGRFGFGIQLAFYQEYLGDIEQICQQLKWSQHPDKQFLARFRLSNPERLPGFFPNSYLHLGNPYNSSERIDINWIEAFFSRLTFCQI